MCKKICGDLRRILFTCVIIYTFPLFIQAQILKSVVYDFDGLEIGATDLPEGDFASGDMAISVAANPLSPGDNLGDRCLKLQLNWNSGKGNFGRGISRYIEFDASNDQLHFFFYNPQSQAVSFTVQFSEDDNQSNAYEYGADDVWTKNVTVNPGAQWTLISIPLKDFADANTGGNGAIDMAFTNNQGMLLSVEFTFAGSGAPVSYFIDTICFSENGFPHGASVFDLRSKDAEDYCLLGAYSDELKGQYHLTPSKFEALFPTEPGKKIRYVNTFIHWAYGTSTTPSEMPGASAQTLLNNGYTPVLTWEPLFAGYDRLDPVQPRLQNILNGEYNSYIDAFANEIKKLSDTVLIRFMHEFEGDWYPWSICKNENDPAKYAATFRFVVDRFRTQGAGKVKWMWCVNSDYAPYAHYNWFVKAYPGDNYVSIVATDIYNNHFPVSLPWWRSFRWQTTESYYYLTKYFPNKPLFICEVGCRERFNSENTVSESKGAWYARMDKEMQSDYHKARALIFFNAAPDQNWIVNSSPGAVQSLRDNVWEDNYYFKQTSVPIGSPSVEENTSVYTFPNPADVELYTGLVGSSEMQSFSIKVYNSLGALIHTEHFDYSSKTYSGKVATDTWPTGIYYVELTYARPGDSKKQQTREIKKISIL